MDCLHLEPVSSRRGAPMGRAEWMPEEGAADLTGRLQLRRLRFVDYCYDEGGAYFGTPANVFHAEGEVSGMTRDTWSGEDRGSCIRVFVRADTRQAAKAEVRVRFPRVSFFR